MNWRLRQLLASNLDAEGIHVDILINNAGIQHRKPMVELELETAEGDRHQPDQRIFSLPLGSKTDDRPQQRRQNY